MKKNLTELVFVLDRSGSMSGLEKDAIGGFNSMLGRQKEEPGEALISTILFDDRTAVSCAGMHGAFGCHGRRHPPHRHDPQIFPGGGPPGENALCHHHRRDGKFQQPLYL